MQKDFFAYAKVSRRMQIAIPKKVQEKLGGINEGDYILFYEDDSGRIYIRKGAIRPF